MDKSFAWLMVAMLAFAPSESGHAPDRVYTDQDGNIHINGSTVYNDEFYGVAQSLNPVLWTGFDDDFFYFVSGDLFTDTSPDTGAIVAPTDAAGGVLTLTTGGTDNNEVYLHTTKEIFLFAQGKTLIGEARIKYTEANTDDANVLVGFLDAAGANAIVDDGAGPKASYSGALFFKADGDTLWSVEDSIGATQSTTSLTSGNSADGVSCVPGGGVWQRLRVVVECTTSTSATARFYIVRDDTTPGGNLKLVKTDTFTYTGATEMQFIVGVKAGGANSEVVSVDYCRAKQMR